MSLVFHNDDPGAVIFGNFINYYQYNTPEERISVFPLHLWSNWRSQEGHLLVLDVGCNAGNFTQLFYKFLTDHSKREVFILGIDIDPVLIERSQETNLYPSNVQYLTCDIMKDMSGIEDFLSLHGGKEFDVTLCLSITMWIHLNHGDDGLKTFLKSVSDLSHMLVIEPQPWKCYQTAQKRMSKAKKGFPHFLALEMRTEVDVAIKDFLENECHRISMYESPETKWKRKVYFFRRQ